MRRLVALPLLAVALTACAGPSLTVVGEVVRPALLAPELTVNVVDPAGRPVAGALVRFGPDEMVADEDGAATGLWPSEPMVVGAEAIGFHPSSTEVPALPEGLLLDLVLEPVILSGTVVTPGGVGLPGAKVVLGEGLEAMSGTDGTFRLERAVPGQLEVSKTAWEGASLAWDGVAEGVQVTLQPRLVRALHITGWTPQNTEKWQNLLRLADETEINALVVDLKDESGQVWYPTAVPLAQEVGAATDYYDLPAVVQTASDHGLYLIGRVVAFQDPIAARKRTDLAILDTRTGTSFTKNGQYFLDPTNPDARRYALDLAAEACSLGVQEIQFDYMRFPDGYSDAIRFAGGSAYHGAYDDPVSGAARVAVIRDFLAEARALLNPMGCAVAVDIFAYVMRTPDDQGIGQRPEDLAAVVDVLSPMIYPDHYGAGNFGFDRPKDHPSEVVAFALDEGVPRVAAGSAILRPWTADYLYTADQVRAEIDSIERNGLGWMLWSATSNHTPGALRPDAAAATAAAPGDTSGG